MRLDAMVYACTELAQKRGQISIANPAKWKREERHLRAV